MTKEEIMKFRDFFVKKLAERECSEQDIDMLTDLFYPTAGTGQDLNKQIALNTANMMTEFARWERTAIKDDDKKPHVEPMSDAEIDALASYMF